MRVALVGEIGGTMEEEAAEYAGSMKKPVVSFHRGTLLASRQEDGTCRSHRHGRSWRLCVETDCA